jgi:hypothetical protein
MIVRLMLVSLSAVLRWATVSFGSSLVVERRGLPGRLLLLLIFLMILLSLLWWCIPITVPQLR